MSEPLAITTCPTEAFPQPVAEAPAAPTASSEWQIIGLTSVAHTLCHTAELAFAGMLLALMKEFQLGPAQATLLGLSGYSLMGIGAIPTGLWTDRWGAQRVLTVYFFWLAISAVAVALAPDALGLAVALTVLGGALSLYHPAGLALITQRCQRRGRAMGINGVAGSIGVACGPLLGAMCAAWGHWRLAYVIIAIAGLTGGIGMLFLRTGESVSHQPGRTGRDQTEDRGNPSALAFLFLAMMLGGMNYRCLMTALPTFLDGSSGLTGLGIAGSLTFLVLILGGVGQYAGGWGADHVKPGWLYVGLIATTVPLALVMAHAPHFGVIAAAAALAVFMFAQQPVENTILAQATSARRRSTWYGIKFTLSFGVGALGAQLVGIIWTETGSLAPVFDVFAVSALAMVLFAFAFVKARPRRA